MEKEELRSSAKKANPEEEPTFRCQRVEKPEQEKEEEEIKQEATARRREEKDEDGCSLDLEAEIGRAHV